MWREDRSDHGLDGYLKIHVGPDLPPVHTALQDRDRLLPARTQSCQLAQKVSHSQVWELLSDYS